MLLSTLSVVEEISQEANAEVTSPTTYVALQIKTVEHRNLISQTYS